jgi:hypothetical protein
MAAYTPSQQSLLLLALMQQEENAKRAQAMQPQQGGSLPVSGDSLESILGVGGAGGGGAYLGSGVAGGGATSAAAVPGILSAAPATQIAPAIPGLAAPAAAAEVGGGAATLGGGTVAAGVAPVAGVAGVVAAPVIGSILLKQAAKRFFNKKGIPRSFKSQDVLTSRTLGRSIPGFENLSPEDKVRLAEQGYKAGVVKFSGHDERMNKLSADKQAEIAARYRAAGLPEPTSDSTVNVRGDELLNLDRYRTNMNLAARYGGEDAGISKGIWERFKPEPELSAYERATAPEKVRAFLDELDAAKIPKAGTGTAIGKPAVIGGMTPKKQSPGMYGSIPKAK